MDGWQKKRSVMRRYDATASMYNARYAEVQTAKIEAGLKHLKKELCGPVLDVGCGTGILFDYVTDDADTIVGLDFSGKTLLEAKKHLRDGNLANVHLVRGDADNMPFSDDAFSHVFAMTILQNSPNPIDTLTEITRVSQNHAVFVITGLKKIFNEQAFKQLLKNARLKVAGVEKENLECCVAVCTKLSRNRQLVRKRRTETDPSQEESSTTQQKARHYICGAARI
jgi:ubiquinone/menaquinone biosynthesis C-methylase UbiE